MILFGRDIQDQGYARPKVLMLVPFRSCVLKIVNILIHLLQKADSSEKVDIYFKNYLQYQHFKICPNVMVLNDSQFD